MKRSILLLLTLTLLNTSSIFACSPCSALSGVTQNLSGTNLELTFTSNAGWQCCYTVQIEIVCESSSFTGIPNYFSSEICINGGGASSSTWATPVPYPLTVIDVSGFCPGTYKWRASETGCGIYTPTFTFVVDGASPMVVDASATEVLICEGESTQLSSSASNGCNGPYSYSWSPTTGLTSPNSANTTATPTATTTYTVTVTEPGSCATTQTQSLTIEVNPLPSATIENDVTVCEGDPDQIVTFTGIDGTAPYTINYTLNGVSQTPIVTTGDTYTISQSTNTPGVYTYQLVDITESSSLLCSQTQNADITVTVGALPVVNAGTDETICDSSPTAPTSVTLSGSGADTYTWDNGATNGVAFNPPIGTTIYTVTGTTTLGCTDTDQISITVNPLPTATITEDAFVCQGAASPLVTFTGAGGTSPYTINYTLNGISQTAVVTTGSTYIINQSTGTPGVYNYQLVDITDASSTTCSQDQTSEVTITVGVTPIVDAGEDIQICEPNPVSPSDVTLSASGAVTYTWSNGISDGIPFVPPTGVTTYTVTGTGANGCTSTDQVTVTAYPLPIAGATPSPTYGNAPLIVEFSNSSQNASIFQWDMGNGNVENTNSTSPVSETYTVPGVYTILLTASNGICWDTVSMVIEVIPPMIVTPPNVFTPNGDNTNDVYWVDVQYGEHFEAKIFNRWGNLMATLSNLNETWDGESNGKEAEAGVYYILYKATDFNDQSIEGHTYFHLIK